MNLSSNFENYIDCKLKDYLEKKVKKIEFMEIDEVISEAGEIYNRLDEINSNLKEETIEEEIYLEPYLVKIAEELQKEINSCDICNDIIYEQNKWRLEEEYIKGDGILEFVQNYIPDYELAKKVIKFIRCPNCQGEPILVVTDREMDNFYGINIEYFNRYNIKITLEEIEELMEVLLNYPMLAIEDEAAKKIKNIIEQNFEEDLEIRSQQILYRGRKRSKGKTTYKEDELKIAPYGITGHGRYNFIGENVLYCSNDVSKLHLELDLSFSEEIDVISLKLKDNVKLFFIEKIFEEFKPLYSIDEIEDKLLKKKYLLTNFISQCAKQVGYVGIEYNCVHDEIVKNYAIFKEEFIDYNNGIKTYNINQLKEINLIM